MNNGVGFERRIERVFRAVEADSSEVSWNATERDPDTGEPRQIDVRVKRQGGTVVHVECRNRKAKQNVQWIEELRGRQLSLQANKMMAVSSSGFTENAVKKARVLGITLFKLSALSEETVNLAIEPPLVYLREIDQIKLSFTLSSSALTPNDLKSKLEKGFPIPFIELTRMVNDQCYDHSDRSDVSAIRKYDIVGEHVTSLDGLSVHFEIVGTARARWEPMKIEPFSFRKLKPGQTNLLAHISDATLPGANVEVIIAARTLSFQIEFPTNIGWVERTYGNQLILEHPMVLGKKVKFRHKGMPQFQFQFSYNIKGLEPEAYSAHL